MKSDEGLAPVVATMLVLAIVVTFFSVYYASVLPTLKAESEMNHLKQVEESFSRLETTLYDILSQPQRESACQVIFQLGGGDIFLDSTRSSGRIVIALNTSSPPQFLTISVNDTSDTQYTANYTISNITYIPDGNYWLNQGYSWQYGYISVIQGDTTTPLFFDTTEDAKNWSGDTFNRLLLPTISRERKEVSNGSNTTFVENITLILPSVYGDGALLRSGNMAQALNINSTISRVASVNVTGKVITFTPLKEHEMFSGEDTRWMNDLKDRICKFNSTDEVVQNSGPGIEWPIHSSSTVYLDISQYKVRVYLQ